MKGKVMLAVLSFSIMVRPAFAQGDDWQKHSKAGLEALGQQRLDDAAQSLEVALREIEKTSIRDLRLADSLSNLALVYQLQRKYGRAESLYVRALDTYKNNGSEDKTGLPLWNLGKLYAAAGQTEKAEATLSRALSFAEKKAEGPENLLAAGILRSLAEAYTKRQAYGEAEAAYKRALPIYEKSLGPEHWTVAETLEGYAALLRKMSRKPEALEAEKRANKIRSSGKKSEPYEFP